MLRTLSQSTEWFMGWYIWISAKKFLTTVHYSSEKKKNNDDYVTSIYSLL